MGTNVPFAQFVLKVHSRCDLACDHCYMYQHADQSWRARPKSMSDKTARQAALRIAQHVRAHGLTQVTIVLHGGEPLLAGHQGLAAIASVIRAALGDICQADLRIHTNGMLLDPEFCRIFREFGIKVGISLDGDRDSNDRHRRYADGRGSHARVVQAIDTLRREAPELYAGLLCTIDVRNDPMSVYAELLSHSPMAIDFLLPHATWDSPPCRPAETAYADWLIAIFDQWQADGMPVPIRMFDSVIRTVHGGESLTESLGLEPSDLLVIETDGAIEQADSLKTAYDGAAATGFDIFADSLDALLGHPGIAARQAGLASLSAKCQECSVVSSCGGGLYAHRYRTGSGFANPSVYCADLTKLIGHIRSRAEYPMHMIASGTFDLLAGGYGDRAAVEQLAEGQQTLRRALVAAIPENAATAQAWSVLSRADRADQCALDEVLAYPFARAWAVQSLREGTETDYLAAVAASAAIRAGIDVTLRLPARAGIVHLPGRGSWLVDKTLDTVRIDIGGGRFEFAAESAALPARVLTAGGLSVVLDDLDPYRDCYGWPTASRLDDAALAAWQRTLSDAWTLIESEYPAYAPGLAAGLAAIVPLAPPEHGRHVSATARQAFGAVAIALPADPAVLALLLIHEFQHAKLGAILDLFDLYDSADTGEYYAPWRPDPRPFEGLLQGSYAHVAVADYWRVRYSALAGGPGGTESDEAVAAAAAFVRWRDQVLEAIVTMTGSGSLTPLGRRLTDRMRATVAPWLEVPVPQAALDLSALAAREHHDAWLTARHEDARGDRD